MIKVPQFSMRVMASVMEPKTIELKGNAVVLKNSVITQTDLRLEQLLKTNNNNYQLNPFDSGAGNRPLEKKLSRNDLFCITHIGLSLTKQQEVDGQTVYANIPLFTYPEQSVFNGTGEAKALETVYQASLDFKTSAQGRLENYLTHHNRYVPERGNIVAEAPQGAIFPMYGPTFEQRGYSRINPNLLIDGDQDNIFDLRLGSGVLAGIDGSGSDGDFADTRNVLVLFVRGFKVEGVAYEKPKNQRAAKMGTTV
jgi:hypothetical protein